jgi:hypothetical protein
MARAWALHPVVPMTWYDNGKHMGTGGATSGLGIEVRCGNAPEVAAHLVQVVAYCPWVRAAVHGERPDHRDVLVEVLPDAPGMEGGPTQREFARFAVTVLRRAVNACMEAGSGNKS